MRKIDLRIADPKTAIVVKEGGTGAVIGGIAGLAAGLGAIAIPGIGPAIAAGPLAVAFGSLGIGAAAGGLIGALTGTETANRVHPAVGHGEETPAPEHNLPHTKPSGSRVYLDGLEMVPRQDRFEDLEHDYRDDFQARNLTGYTYEQYSPAYRYGYTLANDPRFAQHDWPSIEDYARREWESENPGSWPKVKDVIRYAWHAHRSVHPVA